jgi:hypothetical protein
MIINESTGKNGNSLNLHYNIKKSVSFYLKQAAQEFINNYKLTRYITNFLIIPI